MNNTLIERGFEGYTQRALVRHFKTEPKEDVIAYLELLLKENKAQKFKYNNDIIWRATTEILV